MQAQALGANKGEAPGVDPWAWLGGFNSAATRLEGRLVAFVVLSPLQLLAEFVWCLDLPLQKPPLQLVALQSSEAQGCENEARRGGKGWPWGRDMQTPAYLHAC